MNSAETQAAVQEEVNDRMLQAQRDIAAKYARGDGGHETSVSAPTGHAYKDKYAKEYSQRKKKQQQQKENDAGLNEQDRDDEEAAQGLDDDDFDEEDDPELQAIKQRRLKQIREAHNQKMENLGKGHGQYREIAQDEFIAEMTTSLKTVCCFYHKDFERCEIMHHHLSKLAQRHIEAKFVKINAERAPFFVEKLKIRTMPTVVIFKDGVAADKILGFEGLADNMPEGKEDEWPTIILARLLAEKGGIDSSVIVDDDEVEAQLKAQFEAARRHAYLNTAMDADDDELFDD